VAHTYVITSVTTTGDSLVVVGTVDGTAVTVNTWVSAAGNSLGSVISFHNFIAPLMLAAVPPAAVSQPTLVGTFTQ
jgi:hypothetical protein